MSERGIMPYDLAGDFCEECGQAKSFRLWPGMLTGCGTCDEVITRHHCTGRPDLDVLAVGASWECAGCGTAWTAIEDDDICNECGRSGMVKVWHSKSGDRIDTAPRYMAYRWPPFRNLISKPVSATLPLGSCYRMASGAMVHVKPGCRC